MYVKISFTNNNYSLRTTVSGLTVADWIVGVINGTTEIAALPTAAFAINNCVKVGSKPSTLTMSTVIGGDDANPTRIIFYKEHHSVTGARRALQLANQISGGSPVFSWRTRVTDHPTSINFYEPNGTNFDGYWEQNGVYTTNVGSQLNPYTSAAELNFFLSEYWTIITFKDSNNFGGSSAMLEYEATGADTWARSIDDKFYPGFSIIAGGLYWPTSTYPTLETYQGRQDARITMGRMFDGSASTAYRHADGRRNGHQTETTYIYPMIWPTPATAVYPTRDSVGNSQNYLLPVYFYPGTPGYGNTTQANSRGNGYGKIPNLYRTSDFIGQNGDEISIQGVSYRVVRMHRTGNNVESVAGTNYGHPACYLVPTTINGA
jgi:hypothetical protein